MRHVALLFVATAFAGCAVVPSLQTPDVLKPGAVLIGAGITSESFITRSLGDRQRPALSQSKVYARIGALPGTDLGVQMTGALGGFGLDARVQLLRQPLLVAASAGLGASEVGVCLFGCVDASLRARHASLLFGRSDLYGALSLMDYAYRQTENGRETIDIDRIIPGIAFGMTRGRGRVRGSAKCTSTTSTPSPSRSAAACRCGSERSKRRAYSSIRGTFRTASKARLGRRSRSKSSG